MWSLRLDIAYFWTSTFAEGGAMNATIENLDIPEERDIGGFSLPTGTMVPGSRTSQQPAD
ncbi:MAG: hypothetical protein IPN98_11165 [Propionivibrio sp.]|nr:hypothetical protein [Propionivibrio sp.]